MPSSPCARRPEPEALRPMATQMQRHHDILHATDTALRLVNQALGDLGAADPVASAASSATSIAADGMRDGLDRALAVVAELEQEATDARDTARHARYAALRETLRGVMAHAHVGADASSRPR